MDGASAAPPAAKAVDSDAAAAELAQKSVSGKLVGFIRPPPDIRAIVDKTAQFVAKNGPEFEAKILKNEQSLKKFAFLKDDNPYHSYYLHRVQELKQQAAEAVAVPAAGAATAGAESAAQQQQQQQQQGVEQKQQQPQQPQEGGAAATTAPAASSAGTSASTVTAKQALAIPSLLSKALKTVHQLMNPPAAPAQAAVSEQQQGGGASSTGGLLPSPPASAAPAAPTPAPVPQDDFTLLVPPTVSSLDLDVLKLTAQFTAARGREFLSQLTAREAGNPQYAFLRPTHSLFSVFMSLVDAYSLIIHPPASLRSRVAAAAASEEQGREAVLQRALLRMEHKRQQEEQRARDRDAAETDKAAAAAIDWHDFVVVETLTLDDDEDGGQGGMEGGADAALPAPMAAPVGARLLGISAAGRQAGHTAPLPSSSAAAGGAEEDTNAADVEMDLGEDEEEQEVAPQHTRAAAAGVAASAGGAGGAGLEEEEEEEEVKVREHYVSSLASQAAGAQQLSVLYIDPRTGAQMTLEQAQLQLKVDLMDPSTKLQQQKFKSRQADTLYAAGDAVADNLVRLAARRGDIFASERVVEGAVVAGAAAAAGAGGAGVVGPTGPVKKARLGEQ